MSHTTLVDTALLAAHVDDPGWRVFDCRHQLTDAEAGARAYAAGHLPGAFFLHLDRDLAAPPDGSNGRHPLPDSALLAGKLAAAGVSRETQVVAYDDAGGAFASRLWWLLRWLGHRSVAVLDGGIDRWLAEGRAITAELPQSAAATFRVDLRERPATAQEVFDALASPGFCLLDARSADRFRGENETLDAVAGHVPGARNRFYRDNLAADGCFRSAAALRAEFLALLAGDPAERAIVSCGSGVTACHHLLAMEIAGLHGARLYAGSWSEWCSDPRRPIER